MANVPLSTLPSFGSADFADTFVGIQKPGGVATDGQETRLIARTFAKSVTVASAATVNLTTVTSKYFALSGSASVTSFGARANSEFWVQSTGTPTIVHNGTTVNCPYAQNLYLRSGDIFRITTDSAGNATISVVWRANTPLRLKSVRDFGVVGDNSTDDTPALDAAATWASSTSGNALFIPVGFRMKITRPWIIPGGMSGFNLIAQKAESDPANAHLQYAGDTSLPAVVLSYSYTGNQAVGLTATATIAYSSGSSCTVSVDNPTFLSDGGSQVGYLRDIHGTLSRSGSVYTFTRDASGLAETFSTFDQFVPDSPTSGTISVDRWSSLERVSIKGNGNYASFVQRGHGSGEMYTQLSCTGSKTAFELSHQPSRGNDEFVHFTRCNLIGTNCGLQITQSDSYSVISYNSNIQVVRSSGTDRTPAAAVRILGFPNSAGGGFSVFGGNVGSSSADPDPAHNSTAVLEIYGPGDPVSIYGVRSEWVASLVRVLNGGGDTRSINIADTTVASLSWRQLPLFQAGVNYNARSFFSSGGNTYLVVSGGTSGGSGPVTTDGSIETNGSMKVVYVGADYAQDNWLTMGQIVDTVFTQTLATDASVKSAGRLTVNLRGVFVTSGQFNSSTSNDGIGLTTTDGDMLINMDGCAFNGRLFETNFAGSVINKRSCRYRTFSTQQSQIYKNDGYGPPVNYLRKNYDASQSPWVLGASGVSVIRSENQNSQFEPVVGGNSFLLTCGSPANRNASSAIQDLGLAASATPPEGDYVLKGWSATSNQALIVKVTDGAGYVYAQGIYANGREIPFELPFTPAPSSGVSGNLTVKLALMDMWTGGTSATGRISQLQVGRIRGCSYVMTDAFPMAPPLGYYPSSGEELTNIMLSVLGRLIIPSSQRGGLADTQYDLRDGDIRLDSNRLLSFFDGAVFQTQPRMIRQNGRSVPPVTGIWSIGDLVFYDSPTAGGNIGLVCTAAGGFTATGGFAPQLYGAWAATSGVASGQYVYTTGNNVYKCVYPGTTSSTAPSHTSGFAQDGTAWWEYVGAIAAPIFKTWGVISA